MRYINNEIIKFMVVGGINTLSTYIIYVLCVLFVKFTIAYTIAYLVGIIISFYLNTIFVFQSNISFKKFLKFPFIYVIQYFIGLFLLHLIVEFFKLNKLVAPILVIILTFPVTFVLSRKILKRR